MDKYEGLIIPADLLADLEVCDKVGQLLSFECVEWHPANRVMRQYGYVQSPLSLHKTLQWISIALLFAECSSMTREGYMSDGYRNGRIAMTVNCDRGIYFQLLTSNRLLITKVWYLGLFGM
ncbi:hypothetical protein AHAS_Ahas15G0296900 [Arachis hypogaea]